MVPSTGYGYGSSRKAVLTCVSASHWTASWNDMAKTFRASIVDGPETDTKPAENYTHPKPHRDERDKPAPRRRERLRRARRAAHGGEMEKERRGKKHHFHAKGWIVKVIVGRGREKVRPGDELRRKAQINPWREEVRELRGRLAREDEIRETEIEDGD